VVRTVGTGGEGGAGMTREERRAVLAIVRRLRTWDMVVPYVAPAWSRSGTSDNAWWALSKQDRRGSALMESISGHAALMAESAAYAWSDGPEVSR
jgi:hypothetical protein